MTNKAKIIGLLLTTTLIVTCPTVALAADQATDRPLAEDIIVTARRASERLTQVPVQVNVATATMLTRVNATNLEKISENIPFVSITKLSAGNGGAFNIRGIGNYGTDAGVQQSVLLSIDDTFVGRPRIVNGALFDLKQVEVLKGPQALFYGKNTVAGVISVTSADPTDTLSVRGAAGYELKARERFVEAAVSGPLAEGLTARLALRYNKIDGWIKNVGMARANPILPAFPIPGPDRDLGPYGKDIVGRFTLLWKPSADFQARFKYFHDDNRNDGEAGANEIFCAPDISTYNEFGVPDNQTDCKADAVRAINNQNADRTTGQPGANGGHAYGKAIVDLTSLKLSYNSGPVSVTSVTSYYKLSTDSASNVLYGSIVSNLSAFRERSSGLSQELRISTNFTGSLNFMGGFFLSDDKTYYNTNVILFPIPFDPVKGTYESFRRFSDQDTRTVSGFAQARWSILDNLKLEGGFRYSNEKISASDGNTYVNPAPLTLGLLRAEGVYFIRRRSESNISPEVTLTWHPSVDQTLYAAYKTGNKPGGYSFPAVATKAFTEANTSFSAEKVKGVEVGYKAELFARSLRLSVTAYRFEYTNQQTSTFNPAILSFSVQNAAASIVQGVEAEANWSPTRNLNFHAALGYNDAHYKNFTGAQCYARQTVAQGCVAGKQTLSGDTLPRAPKWAGEIGGTYDQTVGGGMKILLTGNSIYTGHFNPGDTVDPFLETKGYFRFNASVAIGPEDGSWEVGVYGRNLSNKYKPVFAGDKALGQPGVYSGIFTRTREILLAAKFQY